MTLRLVLESGPTPQARGDFTLGEGRLVIGRGDDCDWRLDDPQMFISRRHCVVQGQGGQYRVTDESSGGLFIDGAPAPLGPGVTAVLVQGMRLRIGDFVLRAEISAAPAAYAAAMPAPAAAQRDDFFTPRPEAPPPPRPASLPDPFDRPRNDPVAAEPAGGGRPPPQPFFDDPFALDASVRAPVNAPAPPPVMPVARAPDPAPPRPAPSPHAPPPAAPAAQDPFATGFGESFAPAARVEPAVAPAADFDFGDFGLPADLGLPPPAPVAPPAPAVAPAFPSVAEPSPPPPAPAADPAAAPQPVAPDPFAAVPAGQGGEPLAPDLLAPDALATAGGPSRVAVRGARPVARPAPLVLGDAAASPAPDPAPQGTAANPDTAAALLRGLGIDPPPGFTGSPAEVEAIGRRYRAMVEGLIQLLRLRATEKGSARVAQTVIGAANVNPLKFVVGADEAVAALVAPKGPGYLDPDAAIAGTLGDLMDHHQRSWSGLQSALRRMIDKFDPAVFEAEVEDVGLLKALVSGSRSAQLWQTYGERYREMAKSAEDRFLGEIGADFRAAYEGETNNPIRRKDDGTA